jgi:hypothetical protein
MIGPASDQPDAPLSNAQNQALLRQIALVLGGVLLLNIAAGFLWSSELRLPWQHKPSLVSDADPTNGQVDIIRPWIPEPKATKPKQSRFARKPKQNTEDKATLVVQSKPAVEDTCKVWLTQTNDDASKIKQVLNKWQGQSEKVQLGDVLGYVLYLPAERVKRGMSLIELKEKGVSELFFMQSPPELRGSISMGIFKAEAAAIAQKKALAAKGVEGLKIVIKEGTPRTAFRLTGTPEQLAELPVLQSQLKRGVLRACEL